MLNRKTFLLAVAWCGALLAPAVCLAEEDITRPSRRMPLSFTRPGILGQVQVEDGQQVKEGQPLICQDDQAEQAELRALEREAEDDSRVVYARVALKQAELEMERHISLFLWKRDSGPHVPRQQVKEGMATLAAKGIEGLAVLRGDDPASEDFAGPGAVSAMEVERAQLDVEYKRASYRIAQMEFEKAKDKFEQMRVIVERMKLTSPVNGRVERLLMRKGEAADALEDVIFVVQTDPLWVELSIPMDRARVLDVGQAAEVQFPQEIVGVAAPLPAETTAGKITFKSGVANQAGQLMVRVEVPNPGNRPAGEPVRVLFKALEAVDGVPVGAPLGPEPTPSARM